MLNTSPLEPPGGAPPQPTLTHVIDVPAGAPKQGGSASEGDLAVGGRLHLHVAALRVLAGRPRGVPDGGVGVLAVQGAGAVATQRPFDMICN